MRDCDKDKILLGFIIMLAPLLSTTLTLACILEDVYYIVLAFLIAIIMIGVYITYVEKTGEDDDIQCAVNKLKERYPNFIPAIDETFEGLL